jgi:hypothetical protein
MDGACSCKKAPWFYIFSVGQGTEVLLPSGFQDPLAEIRAGDLGRILFGAAIEQPSSPLSPLSHTHRDIDENGDGKSLREGLDVQGLREPLLLSVFILICLQDPEGKLGDWNLQKEHRPFLSHSPFSLHPSFRLYSPEESEEVKKKAGESLTPLPREWGRECGCI